MQEVGYVVTFQMNLVFPLIPTINLEIRSSENKNKSKLSKNYA